MWGSRPGEKRKRGEGGANYGSPVTDGSLLLNSSSTRHIQYAAGGLQPARKDVTTPPSISPTLQVNINHLPWVISLPNFCFFFFFFLQICWQSRETPPPEWQASPTVIGGEARGILTTPGRHRRQQIRGSRPQWQLRHPSQAAPSDGLSSNRE